MLYWSSFFVGAVCCMETANDVAVSSKRTLSPDSNATGVRVSSPATRQFKVVRSHFLASAPSAPPTQIKSRATAISAAEQAINATNLNLIFMLDIAFFRSFLSHKLCNRRALYQKTPCMSQQTR